MREGNLLRVRKSHTWVPRGTKPFLRRLLTFKEIIIISYFLPYSFMPNSTNEESGENNTATSSPSHAIIKCRPNFIQHQLHHNAQAHQHPAAPPLLPSPVASPGPVEAESCDQNTGKIQLKISF